MEIDSDSDTSFLGSKRESSKKEKKPTKLSKTAKKDSKVSKKVPKTKKTVVKKPPKWHLPDGEERITFLNYLKGWF